MVIAFLRMGCGRDLRLSVFLISQRKSKYSSIFLSFIFNTLLKYSFIEINLFIEIISLLKYIFTHLKWTMQWFLTYSRSCATIPTIKFKTFLFPKRDPISLIDLRPHFTPNYPHPHPCQPALGNHSSIFCLFRFADSAFFINEIHNIWPLWLAFFTWHIISDI